MSVSLSEQFSAKIAEESKLVARADDVADQIATLEQDAAWAKAEVPKMEAELASFAGERTAKIARREKIGETANNIRNTKSALKRLRDSLEKYPKRLERWKSQQEAIRSKLDGINASREVSRKQLFDLKGSRTVAGPIRNHRRRACHSGFTNAMLKSNFPANRLLGPGSGR